MRILNLQMNRQFPCLLAVLHLGEAGVVHLLGLDVVLEEHLLQDGLVHLLDVVIEELLPLGEHLVVEHVPGELLLHASKPRHLPLTLLPSLLGWQTHGWQTLGCPDPCGGILLTQQALFWQTVPCPSWLTRPLEREVEMSITGVLAASSG